MLIFEEGGKPETRRKTLGARTRTNNKLNPLMTPDPGFVVQDAFLPNPRIFFLVPCALSLFFTKTIGLFTETHNSGTKYGNL